MDITSPLRVSYDKSDIQREMAEEILADKAWVQVVIDRFKLSTQPTKGKGPGEDIVAQLMLGIVDPSDGVSRVKGKNIFHRLTLPIRNPEFMDTHEPPSWSKGFWAEFVQAAIPERHPKSPKVEKGQWKFKGKKVEKGDVDGIKEELSDARLKEAADVCGNLGEDWLRRTLFGQIKHSDSADGRTFANLNNLCFELPENATLTPAKELTVHTGSYKPNEKTAKGNGARGRAKPARGRAKGRKKKKS